MVGSGFLLFFPLYNFDTNLLNKSNLDLCAAPGGKSFQVIFKNKNIILNDKNNERIKILISNLKRLKFKAKILNFDAINFKNIGQYDFIILDAPCSAVGQLEKTQKFFRTKQPNFDKLIKTQKFLLDTASKLLKKMELYLHGLFFFEI